MTHSHRRKSSRNQYFRMDVPKDVRTLAGVTSWQHSLDTSDPTLSEARRASYTAHYKAEVIRLRKLTGQKILEDASTLVRRAMRRLADYHRSMDVAVASELTRLALVIRSSWSNDHARDAEVQHFGESAIGYWDDEPTPIPAIDGDHDRRLFKLRAQFFEGSGLPTEGLVYQDLARACLARGVYEPLRHVVDYLPHLESDIDLSTTATYSAIAESYLTQLAEHKFASWPEGIREALTPLAMPTVDVGPPTQAPSPLPTAAGHSLRDAFDEWKRRKGILGRDKTADEFEKAIDRFEELYGTCDVALITTEMVENFRDKVAALPSRPKKAIGELPLLEQIKAAEAGNLPTLLPPSVGKQVGGVRVALAAAKNCKWISVNPAVGVTVNGAKWQGDERDHLSDEDMRRLYTSPQMTDPDACSDTIFWILFLAPFHGSRPSEHCKLKPHEIVQEDGEWAMRFRRDRRKTASTDGISTTQRKLKTVSSIRDVPLHWIVLEAGFLEFVAHQQNQGSNWVFDDLKEDPYGDRYKYLSKDINKILRSVGISEEDKSFYSTRHTMKREGRRRHIAKQSLDQLSGHASTSVGDRYGQGLPIETLKEDIDRLEFRSVPWDAVVDCARMRIARLKRA